MIGRPPKSTSVEQELVLGLADEGLSSREIAEAVYGDCRLHKRVLRLLRRRRVSIPGSEVEIQALGMTFTLEETGELPQDVDAAIDAAWDDLDAAVAELDANPEP